MFRSKVSLALSPLALVWTEPRPIPTYNMIQTERGLDPSETIDFIAYFFAKISRLFRATGLQGFHCSYLSMSCLQLYSDES